ncbi:MAG: cytochrome c [bacterium]
MKKVLAVLMCLGCVACGDDSSSSSNNTTNNSTDRATTIAGLTADVAAGMAQYETTCAVCHGADGKGTAAGNDLSASTMDKATIIGVLLNGIPATSMVAYASFTDQQLADLTAYTLQFQQ